VLAVVLSGIDKEYIKGSNRYKKDDTKLFIGDA
jgi:hypothetical protein